MKKKQPEKDKGAVSFGHKINMENFRELPDREKGSALFSFSKSIQRQIVSGLSQKELVDILEHLDMDEATDILQLVPAGKRTKIIDQLNDQLKSGVSLLLQFDPETAAGLMNIDYIQVKNNDPIASVSDQVRVHEKRTGKLPAILVMKDGKLMGYLPGYKLGLSRSSDKAEKYLKRIKSIKYNCGTDKVLETFSRFPHNKIVVLGEAGNVMGIIYSDDVLRILRERESSSLYNFAGLSAEESVYDSTLTKIRLRYKWLILNLGTAFLAASVVGFFDETISKYVLLAVYMPIVAGMGGNAGTQTLAVLVRGISSGQIELKTAFRILRNELGSGLANGVINGLIVTTVVYLKDGDLRIGLILALAMTANLLIAAFFGTIVPLVMKRMGKDPASSATIFITTATDIFGFLVFLGLATIVLK